MIAQLYPNTPLQLSSSITLPVSCNPSSREPFQRLTFPLFGLHNKLFSCLPLQKRSVLASHSSRALSKYHVGQQPREAGFGKLLVILSPVLVTGGVVTYAKYDDNFRKTIVQTVPAIEPALNYLMKEDLGKDLSGAKDTVMGFFGGNSNDTPKKVDDVPPPLAKSEWIQANLL